MLTTVQEFEEAMRIAVKLSAKARLLYQNIEIGEVLHRMISRNCLLSRCWNFFFPCQTYWNQQERWWYSSY
jgi:hypothetical protein